MFDVKISILDIGHCVLSKHFEPAPQTISDHEQESHKMFWFEINAKYDFTRRKRAGVKTGSQISDISIVSILFGEC